MQIHKVIEIVFTLIMLLFLALLVMGILVGITIIQELSHLEVSYSTRVIFIVGMTGIYFYIMRMIVGRIRDYNRYI